MGDFGVMTFVFPRHHSMGWDTCPQELIPCFPLPACTAFVFPIKLPFNPLILQLFYPSDSALGQASGQVVLGIQLGLKHNDLELFQLL